MPRRQVLSSVERESLTALPKDELSLIRMAYLTEQDIVLVNMHRKSANKLGFAILLCYLRNVGFTPEKSIPPEATIVAKIARQLKLPGISWSEYAAVRDETRREHLLELYHHLNLKTFNNKIYQACVQHLVPLATRIDKGSLLAEALIAYLRHHHVVIPSVDVLEHVCAEAMTLGDKAVFSVLNAPLTPQHRAALDGLLITNYDYQPKLSWLLQPPGKINGKNVLQHIDRLKTIKDLGLPEGVERSIHQNRLLKLARSGRKMTSRDLAKFTAPRRYATLVCVIAEARATLTDEIIELHERILNSLFSRAKYVQAERLQKTAKLIQTKLRQYLSVGRALLDARTSGDDPFAAIEQIIPWPEFISSLEETRMLSRKENYDPLHFIIEKYSTLRKYVPKMLAELRMHAVPAASRLEQALDVVKEMYRQQLRKLPLSAPIDFVPASWRKLVITPEGINRQYYEICVFSELKGALRSGDVWVTGSRRYKNFDDYLIPQNDFELARENASLPLAIPNNYQEYIRPRLALLASRMKEVNNMAMKKALPDVVISEKGLRITPLDNRVPEAVSPLADLVYGMLPRPKITEVLDEVEAWTGFTKHFTHLKNSNVRPKSKKLLLTTLLADGINLGLSKMAESCPGTTCSALEGIQAWYVRDETYSAALVELVNAQKVSPLAGFWGDGTTSSSDGQNFRMGSHGCYAGQVNLKYGRKPGVQFYTHISDQYSPFYTQVISHIRDSTHVLDGLLYHQSDVEIQEHYTDTAGFTDHVFALMHLLGFSFAPRIRDLHDKRLFVPGKQEDYPRLQSIISSQRLNLKEIESHWSEVLRLATSIKQGSVTASLMLKKLASYPRQNGLAKALRELGRIERTLFILDWLQDPALRRRVQVGLNKGEARNALARAVFMHRLGEIRDRNLENQRYRASGLTLVTAAIVLWNTVYIERAIEALKRKGVEIDETLLTHLSPLGWEHINLTGDYIWRNNLKLAPGKYRSLRRVNTTLYKK